MRSKIQIGYLALTIAFGLSLVMFISSCKKSPSYTPPDTTTLSAAIDSAQYYLSNTHEGTQAGEYPSGSQATLKAAVTSAQAVLASASTNATQAQVTAATANLNAAIAAYEAGKITPIAGSALVAYWKFNGNANDSSGNGHNGTLMTCAPTMGGVGLVITPGVTPGGMPTPTNDRFGNANSAYHFSNGGHIEVPFSPTLNPQAITVSVWCRQDTAGRIDHPSDYYMVSLARWNCYKLQTQPTLPFFTVSTDSTIYDRDDAGTPIIIGTTTGAGPWSHVVATYDGNGNESFYINGTLVKTWTNLAHTIKQINPGVDLSIGSDLPNAAYKYDSNGADGNYFIGYGGYWTGDMDDIMIYNTALTATQVMQLYTQQATQ